ncbi:YoaK family protein [Arthrobacter koreensis]|uniref:YoaK family protein n=1 Tax=Arthrobacter koreensis TaxID=199136 RepID=UPI00126497F1|nr:YoaK family protein [Arthrobacter koreensis]
MLTHTRSEIALASGLAWTAGYVDAVGFLHLGGYFVSFMTGNSTRAGASVADLSLSGFLQAFGLIAAFFLGVVAASSLRRILHRHRRPAICSVSAAVLGAAWASTAVPGAEWMLAPALAGSMGLLNAVFERGGEVSIGITYMTGTLVKLGQKVTAVLFGERGNGWHRYLLLWSALTLGSLCGGAGYLLLGLTALGPAIVALTAAAAASWGHPGHLHG